MLIVRLVAWILSYPITVYIAGAVLAQATPGLPSLDVLSAAGATGVLSFLVIGFINEWIVPGRAFRREKLRGDRLESTLYKATGITEVLVKQLGDGS